MTSSELLELVVRDEMGWRAWLSDHHEDPVGVWLVLAKKATTEPTSLSYDEALDEALCYGWIDGQVRRRDEATYRQRFTPRTSRSGWSKRNVGLVGRLIDEGRMRERGMAEVARAQADGRWESAYSGQASMKMPEDLAMALAGNARAAAFYELLSSQNRYAVLYRIETAKRAGTRARRIADFVAMLARHETVHPQRRMPPE